MQTKICENDYEVNLRYANCLYTISVVGPEDCLKNSGKSS